MKSVVIYATRTGTTKQVAEAIATVLEQRGSVKLLDVAQASVSLPESDLVIIGGPTERHTLTQPLVRFLDHLTARQVRDMTFAAFDTRLHWPRFLSGSAADEIAARLGAMGVTLVLPPESFFVKPQPEPLTYAPERGELERARAWAAEIANAVDAAVAVEA